ncbi:MAG: type III-B CRISPR module-associated Cmr3 family protein, partial [Anaerolineae bacterium]|nr:type III-B CRISPR module-associated Cmr3 family protein [Anaerolineae bacterium]
MRLFLEAVDVWLFRDGRPFSAGSDHRARSLFPPLPTTVQGMVRSYHLLRQRRDVDLRDKASVRAAVGTSTEFPPGFRMRGPFVAREEGEDRRIWRYFPLPADAAGTEGRYRPLAPVTPPRGVVTSCVLREDEAPGGYRGLSLLIQQGDPAKQEGEWWLREDELLRYLGGAEAEATPAYPRPPAEDELPRYL